MCTSYYNKATNFIHLVNVLHITQFQYITTHTNTITIKKITQPLLSCHSTWKIAADIVMLVYKFFKISVFLTKSSQLVVVVNKFLIVLETRQQ